MERTKRDADAACEGVTAILLDHGIRGPSYDTDGDESVYARQLVGFLWLSDDEEDAEVLMSLTDALEERVTSQGIDGGVRLATRCAREIWRLWSDAQAITGAVRSAEELKAGNLECFDAAVRSNLERFAKLVESGVSPDDAARVVGGTGRPGVSR